EAGADGWQLTGAKAHVPDAAAADVLLVVADAGDALGLFAVDARGTGVAVEPVTTVDVTRREASVTLDAAPAPRPGAGDAAGALDEVVDRTLVAHVVDCVGAVSVLLDMAVAHAKERVQF